MRYQIYQLDEDGNVIRSDDFDCTDDAAAIAAAAAAHSGPEIEIWTADLRLVASIPPKRRTPDEG